MTLGEDFSNFCDINAMHTSMTKDIQWGNVRRLQTLETFYFPNYRVMHIIY